MIVLYNLGIRLYWALINLAVPFKAKAMLFVKGRKGVFEQAQKFRKNNKGKLAWFHAASLGEFEQGLPVMEAFRKEFPEYKIVVSFFSPSGFKYKKDHPIADFTCYLPIDTKSNASRFVNTLNPDVVFFIKYEYWFYYLRELKKRSIPLFSISALFTPDHIFFKPYGGFHRRMLKFFDHTFVQNSSSQSLLDNIGIEDCSVSGDTRFDRVSQTVSQPQKLDEIQMFASNSVTLVVGSAWPEDMEVVADFINEKAGEIKVIIAPHLIDDAHVQKITSYLKVPFKLYSERKIEPEDSVLILNTIGMLSSTYQYADFAYIGGAFGDGLHNILEAVAFGLPVVFGNEGLEKFPESGELMGLGGAFSVDSKTAANTALNHLLNSELRKKASDICLEYIENNKGATEKIMLYLRENLR